MLVGRWWWWWKSGARPLKVLELSAVAQLLPSISVACCHPVIFLLILSLPNLLTLCHLQVTILLGTWPVRASIVLVSCCPSFWFRALLVGCCPVTSQCSESEVAWESCWVDAHLWPSVQTAEGETAWFLLSGICFRTEHASYSARRNTHNNKIWIYCRHDIR